MESLFSGVLPYKLQVQVEVNTPYPFQTNLSVEDEINNT